MTKEEKKKLQDMGTKKVIKKLEALSATEMDYDLVGILARAYNNNDQEQKAKDLMLTMKAEGEKDGAWNYRMGHSCFYLSQYEEALVYLERAKELGCGEWADELLPQCKAQYKTVLSPIEPIEPSEGRYGKKNIPQQSSMRIAFLSAFILSMKNLFL